MRILTINEYTNASVAGGISSDNRMIITVAVGLIGGIAAGTVANAIGPAFTFIGTPLGAIGFGLLCTPFAPGVGTVVCGFFGGLGSYYVSSTFATTAAFVAGAAGSVLLLNMKMR